MAPAPCVMLPVTLVKPRLPDAPVRVMPPMLTVGPSVNATLPVDVSVSWPKLLVALLLTEIAPPLSATGPAIEIGLAAVSVIAVPVPVVANEAAPVEASATPEPNVRVFPLPFTVTVVVPVPTLAELLMARLPASVTVTFPLPPVIAKLSAVRGLLLVLASTVRLLPSVTAIVAVGRALVPVATVTAAPGLSQSVKPLAVFTVIVPKITALLAPPVAPSWMLPGAPDVPAFKVTPPEAVTTRLPVFVMFPFAVTTRPPVVVRVPRLTALEELIVKSPLPEPPPICPKPELVVAEAPSVMAEFVVFAVTAPVTFRFAEVVVIAPVPVAVSDSVEPKVSVSVDAPPSVIAPTPAAPLLVIEAAPATLLSFPIVRPVAPPIASVNWTGVAPLPPPPMRTTVPMVLAELRVIVGALNVALVILRAPPWVIAPPVEVTLTE